MVEGLESPSIDAGVKFTEWKALLGFFTETEGLNLIRSNSIPLDKSSEEAFAGQVKEAIEYVGSITGRKEVIPKLKAIPEKVLLDRATKLQSEPTFNEHILGMKKWSFQLVEIPTLHVFQPHLNLEYVNRLTKQAPESGDIEGLLKFCLPLKDEIPKQQALGAFNPITNTFSLVTENLDMRIVGSVQGEEPQTGRSFIGFAFGGGLHQMSVVEYKGFYMIKNGYHRACALLTKGHKFMPCLVMGAENYQATGATGPGFFNIDIMLSDRSPILEDFLGKAAITYKRRLIRAVLSVHAEVQHLSV